MSRNLIFHEKPSFDTRYLRNQNAKLIWETWSKMTDAMIYDFANFMQSVLVKSPRRMPVKLMLRTILQRTFLTNKVKTKKSFCLFNSFPKQRITHNV